MSEQVYGGPDMQAYTASREAELMARTVVERVTELVKKSLTAPAMAFAGSSSTEERAVDRWRTECRAELSDLRASYQTPEVHRLLDAIAANVR
jgi:hypothetical protein